MFDELFTGMQEDLKSIRQEVTEMKEKLGNGEPFVSRLVDLKTMAQLSGIPYNTLQSKKSYLPDPKLAVFMDTKRYYRREDVFAWLEDIAYNGRQE